MPPTDATGWFTEVDGKRDQDPSAALAAYRQAHDLDTVVADSARLLWITDQVKGVPPAEFHPLLDRAAVLGTGLGRRRALKLLASAHWYDGNHPEAERLWRLGVEAGRVPADECWLTCVENLALAYSAHGRTFEAHVLLGMAIRRAAELEAWGPLAFAHLRRANTRLKLDDPDGAAEEVARATKLSSGITTERSRHLIATTALAAQIRIHRYRDDLQAAWTAVQSQLEAFAEYPPARPIVLAGAHSVRIQIECALQPQNRNELIAELSDLPNRFQLDEAWHVDFQIDADQLLLDHALAEDNKPLAMQTAERLLAVYRNRPCDDELIHYARALGRSFAKLDCVDHARDAYDLAATAALARLIQLHRAAKELPELAEATAADWELLNAHRQRLVARQSRLYEAIVELWQPGNPAFDLVVGDDELLRVCAWCKRVHGVDGTWTPVTQFFPDMADLSATHGICTDCRSAALETSA
ncbi:MAG: hypothetical protein AAF581_17730 [Planctomycetota bacterium]